MYSIGNAYKDNNKHATWFWKKKNFHKVKNAKQTIAFIVRTYHKNLFFISFQLRFLPIFWNRNQNERLIQRNSCLDIQTYIHIKKIFMEYYNYYISYGMLKFSTRKIMCILDFFYVGIIILQPNVRTWCASQRISVNEKKTFEITTPQTNKVITELVQFRTVVRLLGIHLKCKPNKHTRLSFSFYCLL